MAGLIIDRSSTTKCKQTIPGILVVRKGEAGSIPLIRDKFVGLTHEDLKRLPGINESAVEGLKIYDSAIVPSEQSLLKIAIAALKGDEKVSSYQEDLMSDSGIRIKSPETVKQVVNDINQGEIGTVALNCESSNLLILTFNYKDHTRWTEIELPLSPIPLPHGMRVLPPNLSSDKTNANLVFDADEPVDAAIMKTAAWLSSSNLDPWEKGKKIAEMACTEQRGGRYVGQDESAVNILMHWQTPSPQVNKEFFPGIENKVGFLCSVAAAYYLSQGLSASELITNISLIISSRTRHDIQGTLSVDVYDHFVEVENNRCKLGLIQQESDRQNEVYYFISGGLRYIKQVLELPFFL